MIEKSQYKTLKEWKDADLKFYRIALRKGLIQKICKTFGWKIRKVNWTKDACIEEAKKYGSIAEWIKQSKGSHKAAKRNGWCNECTKHMKHGYHKSSYWTKYTCVKEAKRYKSIGEWAKSSQSSYRRAKKKGWFEDCSKHMVAKYNSWTREKCLEEALKFQTRSEWMRKSSGSYNAARRYNIYEICVKHMIKKK